MKQFSKNWKSSKNQGKQRKYRAKAPLHLRSKLLSVNLGKALRAKYGKRTIRIRSGDKVKIMRGAHKGKEVKIDRVDMKRLKVFSSKIMIKKKAGANVEIALEPSNLSIVTLNLDDKERKKSIERKKDVKKEEKSDKK